MEKVASQIFDNHGRPINYLRIAVTDRCNLRCFYCMPEEGIKYLPKQALLTYEELVRIVSLLAPMGINKIRITGGEPFVRKELMSFIETINHIDGINNIAITTNGVLTEPFLDQFVSAGIKSVNLSLDTLDPEKFKTITRRDSFDQVFKTLHALIDSGMNTKINAVIMQNHNTDDIVELAAFTKDHQVDVRFIEEMPFNGDGANYPKLTWNHKKIYQTLKDEFPEISQIDNIPHATATLYSIPGHKGNVGIIPAFTRTFCGSCNRIRLTAQGELKTCLYDEGVLDIKKIMRDGADDETLRQHFLSAFSSRAKDGFEAEQRRKSGEVRESMSTIGG